MRQGNKAYKNQELGRAFGRVPHIADMGEGSNRKTFWELPHLIARVTMSSGHAALDNTVRRKRRQQISC